jgi:hypothetical protein
MLAEASAYISILYVDDGEYLEVLSSLPGAAALGTTQFLCLYVDKDSKRGLPFRSPEAELLLHGLVVQGAHHSIEIEVLGAIDQH